MPDRNQKIVIVEDDASMRQAMERILLTAGYEAKWYESAESIIEVDGAITAAAPVPPRSGGERHVGLESKTR